jgi:hypothetical protein
MMHGTILYNAWANEQMLINNNTQTKQYTIIKQKQSLVHRVHSGVAIMLHMYGVASFVHS